MVLWACFGVLPYLRFVRSQKGFAHPELRQVEARLGELDPWMWPLRLPGIRWEPLAGVERVHTANYEGKKKRDRGGFHRRADYKKVYVTLKERWFPPEAFRVKPPPTAGTAGTGTTADASS